MGTISWLKSWFSPDIVAVESDTPIRAGGEHCPCGTEFRRIARRDESTDYYNLHYDICDACGFETYAYNNMDVKTERYEEWKRENN